jgi:hypothetical protein
MNKPFFIEDSQVQEALDFLTSSAVRLGKLTEEATLSSSYVKHVMALEMKRTEGPANAQEREARASESYLNAITDEAVKAGELAKLRALRDAASATIEAWRTMQATYRANKL